MIKLALSPNSNSDNRTLRTQRIRALNSLENTMNDAEPKSLRERIEAGQRAGHLSQSGREYTPAERQAIIDKAMPHILADAEARGWDLSQDEPPKPKSRLGKDVIYVISDSEARQITERRIAAGRATINGNDVRRGDAFPAKIVRDFGVYGKDVEAAIERATARYETMGSAFHAQHPREKYLADLRKAWTDSTGLASTNLQVFLDGTDTYWATSRSEFDPEKHGRWSQLENGSGMTVNGDWIPDPEGHWIALKDFQG